MTVRWANSPVRCQHNHPLGGRAAPCTRSVGYLPLVDTDAIMARLTLRLLSLQAMNWKAKLMLLGRQWYDVVF